MTKRSTTHATFAIEREYAHPPAKVFAAYADPPMPDQRVLQTFCGT